MLDSITPVIITFNEEDNIARTLDCLRWAQRVVIVDSGSTDRTVRIALSYPNVEVFTRAFDCHANQWQFAIGETCIETEWVLRLDADYVMTEELISEISSQGNLTSVDAFSVRFRYAINGYVIRSSLYPPNTILFRRGKEKIVQRGHTERWSFEGLVQQLTGRVVHDDRKSLHRWLQSQLAYASQEAEHLIRTPLSQLSKIQRIRRTGWLAPVLSAPYTLLIKGAILDGLPGCYYALQRLLAEVLIALEIADRRLRANRQ